jgi:hypothetical protein
MAAEARFEEVSSEEEDEVLGAPHTEPPPAAGAPATRDDADDETPRDGAAPAAADLATERAAEPEPALEPGFDERVADGAEGDETEYDLLKAQEAKALGNERYGAAEWQLACDAYTEAIMWAPPEAEVRSIHRCEADSPLRGMRRAGSAPAAPSMQPSTARAQFYTPAVSRSRRLCSRV